MLTIPGYTVRKELGRGGMGVVYLAHNALMDRLEVITVIRADGALNPAVKDRFLKEIQAAARLNHPNVVTAYSALQPDGGIALATARRRAGVRAWWDRNKPDAPWPSRFVPLFDGATLNGWREVGPDAKW